jgi:hypothetical protein
VARRAAASAGPDIVGLGSAGVSLTGLGSPWRASLALALGPLPPATGPVAARVEEEPWRPLPSGPRVDVGPDVALWRVGAGVELHDRRDGARARLVGDRVLLSSPKDAAGAAATGRVAPFALAPPLLAADVALLHGAALADGDRGVLVLGPTGAGKSTTAAAARSVGLAVLGDDIAAVEGTCVQGLARPVRVPPDLAPGAVPVAADARRRVTPDGWATGGAAELVGVVLVGHGPPDGPAPTEAPADPAAVARAVVAAAFATCRPASVAPALAVGTALARLPGWHLPLAADPGARLPAAADALSRILAGR